MSEVTAAPGEARAFFINARGGAGPRTQSEEIQRDVRNRGVNARRLLMLKHEVDNGDAGDYNPRTQEDQECRIVYLGDPGTRDSVWVSNFSRPPRFWEWNSATTRRQ